MKLLNAALTTVVLATTASLGAQTPQNQSSSNTQSHETQTKPAGKDELTVTGCVALGDQGKYLLRNASYVGVASTTRAMPPSGPSTTAPVRSYELTGQSDLKTHVGHKVEVKGTLDDSKVLQQQGQTSASTSQSSPEVLKVTAVKPVADTCS